MSSPYDGRITAMMRIRDEAEFLEASVRSVAEHVDRILLVDNLSSDTTPEIMQQMQDVFPEKTGIQRYPYEVARVGKEQHERRSHGETPGSPHLLATYYNWCLSHCHTEFVLKWDGDMIALPGLAKQIKNWRASSRPMLVMQGANVHPNRHNLLDAKVRDKPTLAAKLDTPGLPGWATKLTYDHPEPRLFPRQGAEYETSLGWVERLSSPYWTRERKAIHRFVATEPCFLHMKFCKADPWTGYSPDLAKIIADNITLGPAMPESWIAVLRDYGHG